MKLERINIGLSMAVLLVIAGCESGRAMTDGGSDGAVPDATAHDTGVVDMTTAPDLGSDTGTVDLGTDAGTPDVDLGTDAGDVDAGSDAGDVDAGSDAGDVDAGSPCTPIAIDCTSGTVTGMTTAGSRVDTWGTCDSGDDYDRDDSIYTFTSGMTGRVVVAIDSTETGTTDDFDLFAVVSGATACDASGLCADESRAGGGNESISFIAGATDSFLVGYDRYASGAGSVSFTLAVTCTPIVCNDGVVNGGEECDDGNLDDGDGCSSTCHTERTFACSGEPSTCTTTCGDGALDPGESCDDNGTAAADGCDATCLVETGYGCTGAPSTCTTFTCGNGTLQVGEACDDSNVLNGDGCSSTCTIETFTAAPAPGAASVVLSGSIDATDPTFTRADQFCAADTTMSYYDTYVIQNTTTSVEQLTFTAAWADDGYLLVYAPPFDPTMPVAQCVAGDDDFGTNGSQVVNVALQPGHQLIVVATTWDFTVAIGAYTITVDAH